MEHNIPVGRALAQQIATKINVNCVGRALAQQIATKINVNNVGRALARQPTRNDFVGRILARQAV